MLGPCGGCCKVAIAVVAGRKRCNSEELRAGLPPEHSPLLLPACPPGVLLEVSVKLTQIGCTWVSKERCGIDAMCMKGLREGPLLMPQR